MPSAFIWCSCLAVNERTIVLTNTVICNSQPSLGFKCKGRFHDHTYAPALISWDKQPEILSIIILPGVYEPPAHALLILQYTTVLTW